jgi:hypothetical protein
MVPELGHVGNARYVFSGNKAKIPEIYFASGHEREAAFVDLIKTAKENALHPFQPLSDNNRSRFVKMAHC